VLVSANFIRRSHLPMAQFRSKNFAQLCTPAIKIITVTIKWGFGLGTLIRQSTQHDVSTETI